MAHFTTQYDFTSKQTKLNQTSQFYHKVIAAKSTEHRPVCNADIIHFYNMLLCQPDKCFFNQSPRRNFEFAHGQMKNARQVGL